jgi:hypothetical protein
MTRGVWILGHRRARTDSPQRHRDRTAVPGRDPSRWSADFADWPTPAFGRNQNKRWPGSEPGNSLGGWQRQGRRLCAGLADGGEAKPSASSEDSACRCHPSLLPGRPVFEPSPNGLSATDVKCYNKMTYNMVAQLSGNLFQLLRVGNADFPEGWAFPGNLSGSRTGRLCRAETIPSSFLEIAWPRLRTWVVRIHVKQSQKAVAGSQ